MLLCQFAVKEAVNVVGQVRAIRLEEHRETIFDALSVRDGVHSQQEWNDKTASLVYLLHLTLHRDQSRVFLPLRKLRKACPNAIFQKAAAWVLWVWLEKLEVALRVNV